MRIATGNKHCEKIVETYFHFPGENELTVMRGTETFLEQPQQNGVGGFVTVSRFLLQQLPNHGTTK